jgi:hypothetical protein
MADTVNLARLETDFLFNECIEELKNTSLNVRSGLSDVDLKELFISAVRRRVLPDDDNWLAIEEYAIELFYTKALSTVRFVNAFVPPPHLDCAVARVTICQSWLRHAQLDADIQIGSTNYDCWNAKCAHACEELSGLESDLQSWAPARINMQSARSQKIIADAINELNAAIPAKRKIVDDLRIVS